MSNDESYNYEGTDDFFIENGIIRGYDSPWNVEEDFRNYGDLMLKSLRAKPQFVAQVDGLTGRQVTFAEMLEKSVKCATWLKKQNLQSGDVIAISTHNQVDMYVPCFAALYVGIPYNAWWSDGLTKEMAKYFITLTSPKILFATEEKARVAREAAKELNAEMKIIIFDDGSNPRSLNDILNSEVADVENFRSAKLSSIDDTAFIMYSSGTSGLPKGVEFSHKCLRKSVEDYSSFAEIRYMTSLTFSPLGWYAGNFSMYRCFVWPDTRIVHPKYSEETCLRLIEKFKVNWLYLPTSSALRLAKSPARKNYDLTSIKIMGAGGSPVKEEAYKAFAEIFPNSTIFQAYGMTELGGLGVRETSHYKPGTCGRIVKNYSLKVIDPESGKILGPNKTGEACFKYSFMMKGYYRNPEETRKIIDSEGWLHTGDLLYYDEEGYLFYVDRMKEIIKYREHHVSPLMIEQLLRTHPGVIQAAVFGTPHEADDMHPMAFVVKAENAEVSEEELQKFVADVLPDYMRLRGGVKFLKELPLTPSGKIARGVLKKMVQKSRASPK